MATPFVYLKCVGTAALKFAVKAVPFGDAIAELAHDVYGAWTKDKDEAKRREELQEVAMAAAEVVRAQVAEIVQDIAGDQPAAVQKTLTAYLNQVPAAIHQSLRRPSDPTGTTIPPTLAVLRAEDLIPLLPIRLPRFQPGDRPLPGVDWELEELLGIGGFGEVWKARNKYMPMPVALKFCLDESAARALRNEATLLARVMQQGLDPGIVQLRQTYLSAVPPCLEYEYVEGGNLAGLIGDLQRHGKLDVTLAATVIRRVARTVGAMHCLRPPIVHRDLKPANILVRKDNDGRLHFKVADFGIGAVVAQRDLAGIPGAR